MAARLWVATTTAIEGGAVTLGSVLAIRVLVLSQLYPPHAVGGYELACGDVAERWRAADIEVEVLASRCRLAGVDDGDQRHVRRSLTCFYGCLSGHPPPTRRLPFHVRLAQDHLMLASRLRRFRPDVVSVWHPVGLSVTLLHRLARSGVPIVYVVCDPWPVYAATTDPTAAWVGRPGYPAADLGRSGRWVFCSESLRSSVVAASPLDHVDTDVAWLGVDERTFPVLEPDDPPWQWRLLFVGRVAPEKGVETLVRALAHLPAAATLEVLGHGPPAELDRLRALAAEAGAGDRVRFGSVAREELPARYRDTDVVVFPSEWDEPFGLVPLEAMACARPVVASGTGGSGEYLVDGGNCVLSTPGDPEALAAAVRRLADDAALRAAVVAGGAKTAAELTAERMAHQLEAIHRQAAQVASAVR